MTFSFFHRSLSKLSATVIISQIALGSSMATLPIFTQVASANADLTAATNGTNIDARTAGTTWTTLSGPILTSIDDDDLPSSGDIVLTIAGGFVFDTGAPPTVTVTCTSNCGSGSSANVNNVSSGTPVAVSMTSTTITFTITDDVDSSAVNSLTWSGIKIRPTSVAAATTQLTKSGVTISGESATNWGSISAVLPTCDGSDGTIFVTDAGAIYGGPMNGLTYNGVLVGTSGADTIIGTTGVDYIDGLDGNDNICGSDGNDILNGGSGNDDIFGGNGADSIFGGDNNDNLDGDAGNDVIFGGNNNDNIDGGADSDQCNGGPNTDSLSNCGGGSDSNVGVITIVKDASPDNAQDFTFSGGMGSFTLDDDSDATLPNSRTMALSGGTDYAITEGALGGWSVTGLTCTGGGGDTSTSTGTRTATVGLDQDEEVTCTFTNTAAPTTGTLRVTKVSVGSDATFDFTGAATFQITTSHGSGTYSITNLAAGTYSVSETAPTGWDLTGNTCTSVSVTGGSTTDCIITNTKRASITITNETLPDGDVQIFDFNGSGTFDANLTDGQSVTQLVAPGSYSVTEVVPTGWTLGPVGSISCVGMNDGNDAVITNPGVSFEVDAGDVISCTYTNSKKATITVTTNVANSGGGTAVPSDYTMGVIGTNASPTSFPGTDTGETVSIDPGTFAISLTEPVNPLIQGKYTLLFTGTCAGTLLPGESVSCTYTMDDKDPTLQVIKQVTNNNGGTVQSGSVVLNVNGSPVLNGEVTNRIAGTLYTVTEVNPSGYTAILTGDCNSSTGEITLELDQHAVCIFTNDDQPAQLTIIKNVINDNGGTLTATGFTMTIAGNNPSATSFPGQGGTGTTISIDAGSFTVDEVANSGYTKTMTGDCSGPILPGESKTCTITNDDIAPKITVNKVVVNSHGGLKGVSDFPLFVDATPVLSGSQVTLLTAGTYLISETSAAGYSATFTGDCDPAGNITLAIGETKTCTITNVDDVPPILIVTKSVINDNGGTLNVVDFEFDLLIDGVSKFFFAPNVLSTGLHTVSELSNPEYTPSFGGDCASDGTITLLPGDVKTCLVINNDNAPSVALNDGNDVNTGGSGRRGSQTNKFLGALSFILSHYGFDGTTANPAFGGGDVDAIDLTDDEIGVLCSMQRDLATSPVSDEVLKIVAEGLITRLGYVPNEEFTMEIMDLLKNTALCEDVNAYLVPQNQTAKAAPREVELAVDGYPVSSNDVWNKCVRGTATLEDIKNNEDVVVMRLTGMEVPLDCGAYRTSGTNEWRYPDDPFLTLIINPQGYGRRPTVSAKGNYVIVQPNSVVSK